MDRYYMWPTHLSKGTRGLNNVKTRQVPCLYIRRCILQRHPARRNILVPGHLRILNGFVNLPAITSVLKVLAIIYDKIFRGLKAYIILVKRRIRPVKVPVKVSSVDRELVPPANLAPA